MNTQCLPEEGTFVPPPEPEKEIVYIEVIKVLPAPDPIIIYETVEKIVEKEVFIDVPVEVIKEVEVVKEVPVEKKVEVKTTPVGFIVAVACLLALVIILNVIICCCCCKTKKGKVEILDETKKVDW